MQTIKNISLYLSNRRGTKNDYSLILGVYPASESTGLPLSNSYPVIFIERPVFDIKHDGWYNFILDNELQLGQGTYVMVLYHKYLYNNLEDSKNNFVEWMNSSNVDETKDLISFSSDIMYNSPYSTGDILVYGYGMGIGSGEDYFDVLSLSGDFFGYGTSSFESEYANTYGYGYGQESEYVISNKKVQRCFKIYESMNKVQIDETVAKIDIPPSEEETVIFSNRQDFMISEKRGSDVSDSSIILSDSGEKIYVSDTSLYEEVEPEWNIANFYLPNNDLNDVDVCNPYLNQNQYKVWLISAPYYSGVCFSADGASSWEHFKNLVVDNVEESIIRNFSCVKLSDECRFALAFDNTSINAAEIGKVFYADLQTDGAPDSNKIYAKNINWSYCGRIEDENGGVKVNRVLLLNNDVIYVATDRGIYYSEFPFTLWINFDNGLNGHPKINDIKASFYPEYGYGYGYGYGSSYESYGYGYGYDVYGEYGYGYNSEIIESSPDYFDVFGLSGYKIGYGEGTFEIDHYGELSFGYGYERLYDVINLKYIYIATDQGCYVLKNGYWEMVGDPAKWAENKPLSICVSNESCYVGTTNGLLKAKEENGEFLHFFGDTISDMYYAYGLLRRRTIDVFTDIRNENIVYIGQQGGIFVSRNGGGNFYFLSKNLPEKKINKIILNPLNNKIVYVLTETLQFSNSAITIMIDSSGSMVANDPNNSRIDSAKKIVREIYNNSTEEPFFQVVSFGLPENNNNAQRYSYNQFKMFNFLVDYPGAQVLTYSHRADNSDVNATAFIPNSNNEVIDILDDCRSVEHSRTPFWDSVKALSKGIGKHGAFWEYNNFKKEYVFDDIRSEYFGDLHKSVIIFTDGQDTARLNYDDIKKDIDFFIQDPSTFFGEKAIVLNDLITNFSKMACEVYIVGVGNNINYDNLSVLRTIHPYAHLYLAPFEENLYRDYYGYGTSDLGNEVMYLDAAEEILMKEKNRQRNGYWKKNIKYNENRIINKCSTTYNLPPLTGSEIRLRAAQTKEVWGDWTGWHDLSEGLFEFEIFGKYVEIEIHLLSESTFCSPEIFSISVSSLKPSKSYIYYNLKNSDSALNELYFNTNDSFTRKEISEDSAYINWGFLNSGLLDFSSSIKIKNGVKNIISRKEKERLTTTNGYYYYAEMGAWGDVEDYDVKIYYFGNIVKSLYYSIEKNNGLVIFYEKQINSIGKFKEFTINIPNGNAYRIGAEIGNYINTYQTVNLYDVSWMYDSKRISQAKRDPLPYAASQLSAGTFGRVYQGNYAVAKGFSETYLLQYILKEKLGKDSNLYLTTGQYLNVKRPQDTDNWVFLNQNTFMEKFNTNNYTGYAYTTALTSNGGAKAESMLFDQNAAFNSNLYYKIKINNLTDLSIGDTINVTIGDTGGNNGQYICGMPMWLKQDNLIFAPTDQILGEWETSFVFGETGFNKPIEPKINLCGTSAQKIVVIAPTKPRLSEIIYLSVIAVDINGLIDRTFKGIIEIQANDQITLSDYILRFTESDKGCKRVSGFVNHDAAGSVTVKARFENGDWDYSSNQIYIDATQYTVKWGDLNVSTNFSDGRQDVGFVVNYAKNISNLDFVGIVEDLNTLKYGGVDAANKKWRYLRYQTEMLSSGDFLVYHGVRHRSPSDHGERVVVFSNVLDSPYFIYQNESTGNAFSDLISFSEYLGVSKYVSFPVHPSYRTFGITSRENGPIFKNRSFDFNNYKKMVSYGSYVYNLIYLNEQVAEIYSEHGFCEDMNTDYSTNTEKFESIKNEKYIKHALRIGKKFGFIANSGGYASRPGYYAGDLNHDINLPTILSGKNISSNKGLTAIVSENFDRMSLIENIKRRKCYATTGARIYLEFLGWKNSTSIPMGEVYQYVSDDLDTEGKITFNIILAGKILSDKSPIKEIKIFRIETGVEYGSANEEIYSINLDDHADIYEFNYYFADTTKMAGANSIKNMIVNGREFCYYLRVEQHNGHCAWGSPIWFNFGKVSAIIPTGYDATQIKKIDFINVTGDQDFNGTISSSIDQTRPAVYCSPEFQSAYRRLSLRIDTASITTDSLNPVTRKTYSDRYLEVCDLTLWNGGSRVFASSGNIICYGTYCLKFIADTTLEKNNFYSKSNETVHDASGVNAVERLTAGASYKTLNDGTPYKEEKINDRAYTSLFNARSKMFGYPIFAINYTDNIKNQYQNGSEEKYMYVDSFIVRDPYLFYSGGWYMAYSGREENYPEKNNSAVLKTFAEVNTPTAPATIDYQYMIREDFAGLLSEDIQEDKHKMYMAKAESDFIFNKEFEFGILNFSTTNLPKFDKDESSKIYYPSSPSIVVDHNYKMYFIAWFNYKGVMYPGLFCHEFYYPYSSLAGASTGYSGDIRNKTTLSFIFSSEGYPEFWSNLRKTTVSKQDLFWGQYRKDARAAYLKESGNTAYWPEIHPSYGIGFYWVSVVKNDDGVYYAFFNKNTQRDKDKLVIGGECTGVLYSLNGTDFYEFNNKTNLIKLDDIPEKIYMHPFKTPQQQWAMAYNDVSDPIWGENWTRKTKYSIFNWNGIANFSLKS